VNVLQIKFFQELRAFILESLLVDQIQRLIVWVIKMNLLLRRRRRGVFEQNKKYKPNDETSKCDYEYAHLFDHFIPDFFFLVFFD
jgi:hypothetical protein